MKRKEILDRATTCVCGDREKDHGKPEDSFAKIAALWAAYTGYQFDAVDAAVMLGLLKTARIKTSPGVNDDNFVDLAGYAACAGELAAAQAQRQEKAKDFNPEAVAGFIAKVAAKITAQTDDADEDDEDYDNDDEDEGEDEDEDDECPVCKCRLFDPDEHIEEGSYFTINLNDGREVDFICTAVEPDAYRFESRDCLGEYVPATKLDDWLEDLWINKIPEELKSEIIPTKRKHLTHDGKTEQETVFLFLPSAAEIFPEDKCYGDKGLYKQLDYYKDVHNRIRCKQKSDFGPDWYWTSSPRSGNSTTWCYVNNNGNANNNYASNTNVAAPICFRISR